MQELWKLVSSPRHLLVFEAAARTGSFTRAAQELNVQQPAVSASIKQLEGSLGTQLFVRAHRSVTLTHAGERLYNDTSGAFDRILQSARLLTTRSANDHVTLSASTAFAHYWMVPRLAKFHTAHPDIDLRLQTSEREPDIDAEAISLAIRRGTGDWSGCESHLIAPEVIAPIASPRVMAAAINLKTVANLLNQSLIHLEEPVRDRPSWADYFAHWRVPYTEPKTGLRLNDYALVLQAAIAGEGFAFGWQHVTQGLIAQGLLAARPEWAWTTGAAFYLVWSNSRPLSPQAEKVRDWLVSLSARTTPQSAASPTPLP
ncbi:Glycine cleavage system transcriptional activator [Roseovarius litorisediminis]|uniref:Glycine cleavage system transcriptional activator n=1 Tax=Roseovarius litorisediminis TaxID=1312363 RepID=A0A1Y5RIU8_9RHOB|nr:LysR substrate-binding domain-containing protein [Roseovarius litorisediminis]SLN18319.1 Glycine cleavage system transcriptional activator [Roseovarius litorisediminis]